MKTWKKISKKWMAGTLAAVLVCGSTGMYFYEGNVKEEAAAAAQAKTQEHSAGRVREKQAELSDKDKKELSKEETVYVIADADGSPQKLVVSDWLKNAMNSQNIEDSTNLTDVKNVKGSETFEQKNGSLGIWDANGNDIYYQGSIQKELPVDMKVTYSLDGKNITPGELAGKSGKVTIRFDYTNRQRESVVAGDTKKELYVPFVVLTGTVLENDRFSNIEVTNGKAVNDGERTAVMGVALPGLRENLNIDSADVDIPGFVEITADVTDFELATTLTVATSEIFNDLDLDDVEGLDDLEASMDDLQDAMGKLLDGSWELYDGVDELYEKSGDLTDGMNELNDGARKLKDGVSDLNSGAKDLKDGTETLKNGTGALKTGALAIVNGLAQLSANSDTLRDGAAQVYTSLLNQINAQLAAVKPQLEVLGFSLPTLTIDNWAGRDKKGNILADDGDLQQIINTLVLIKEGDGTAARPALQSQLTYLDNSISQMKELPAVKQQEQPVPEEQSVAEEQSVPEEQLTPEEQPVQEEQSVPEEQPVPGEQPAPEALVQKKEYILVQAAPGDDPAEMIAELEGKREMLVQRIQDLDSAIASLTEAKASLAAYDQFYIGLVAYTKGVDTINAQLQQSKFADSAAALDKGAGDLCNGAKQLKDGAGQLSDGASELKKGMGELKDGGQKLRDGVTELRDGAGELKDGLNEFNEEGIQKLADAVDGELTSLLDNLRGTADAARTYKSFAGISDGMNGSVKFIYKTAAIETEKE